LGGAAAAAAAMIEGTASSAQAVVVGNLVFNIMMSGALNQLWSMINT